jgi:hypothetical protein
MKANGAPEKIYLEAIYPDNGVLPNGLNYTPSPTDIEYTRTDAFIENAWEWIENNILSSNQQDNSRLYYEKFKNYMKEE